MSHELDRDSKNAAQPGGDKSYGAIQTVDPFQPTPERRYNDLAELPPSRATFSVFRVLALMTGLAALGSWWLIFSGNPGGEKFATLALSPLLTIMASAAGYYFASRPRH